MSGPAAAFVPGHVTGFFSVHRTDDPATTGSRGAGVALTDGVTVRVAPAAESRLTLDGREVAVEPVERVLEALSAPARVEATTPLPLGAGFGVSGALALGAALAANEAFDRARSTNDLVRLAHVAEVESDTGLGDAVAQARGGLPVRLDPGAPGEGRLDGVPARSRVEYVVRDGLRTAEVIGGDTDRLSGAGEAALSELVAEPTPERFVAASCRFAREAGLLTDRAAEIVEAARAAGGGASMAMLGETVFALGTALTDAGYDAEACRIDACGARLLGEP